MDILELREYFLNKIRYVFGLIDYECKSAICRYEGVYQQIHFKHPKDENLKISLFIYNKNNICIYTTKDGTTCFNIQAIHEIEKRLEELLVEVKTINQ